MLDSAIYIEAMSLADLAGKLPKIEAEDRPTFKKFAQSPPRGTLTMVDREIAYEWSHCPPTDGFRLIDLSISIGKKTIVARFERALLEAYFLFDVEPHLLDPSLSLLLTEYLLGGWLEKIETALGSKAVLAMDFDPPRRSLSPFTFNVTIEEGDQPFPVCFYGNTEVIGSDLSPGENASRSQNVGSVPIDLTACLRGIKLDRAIVDGTHTGDLIFLDAFSFERQLVSLMVADREIGTASFAEGVATVQAVGKQGSAKIREGSKKMLDVKRSDVANAAFVEVSLEFGHMRMSVAELSDLCPGAVIELGADVTDEFQIRANGAPLFAAQLVTVGDGVGLRITKVF